VSIRYSNDVTDFVDLGNIIDAHFLHVLKWSVLIFFRIRNSAADDRMIIAKNTNGGNDQFRIRVDAGTAPQNIEVEHGDTFIATGGDNVALNTWFLVATTCDGAGNFLTYLVDMGGVFLDDGVTGTTASDKGNLTAPIVFGVRQEGPGDPMDGEIQYPCYINNKTFTKPEILEYLRYPVRMGTSFGWDCVFLLDMGFGGTPTVKDLSPRRNIPILNGGPLQVGGNPPSIIDVDDFLFAKAAAAPADVFPDSYAFQHSQPYPHRKSVIPY